MAAAATPPEASTGAPAPPTPGAALAPERPQGSQGGTAPGVVVHADSKPGGRDAQNRSGSPIARKDKRLLDLLD